MARRENKGLTIVPKDDGAAEPTDGRTETATS